MCELEYRDKIIYGAMYYELDQVEDIEKLANKIHELFLNRNNLNQTQKRDRIRKIHDIFRSDRKNSCVGALYRTRVSRHLVGYSLAKDDLHCEHSIPVCLIENWASNYLVHASIDDYAEFIFLMHAVTATCISFDRLRNGCAFRFFENEEEGVNTIDDIDSLHPFRRYSDDVEIFDLNDTPINLDTYTIEDHKQLVHQLYNQELGLLINRVLELQDGN